MNSKNNIVGKILYGLLFVVILPVILLYWAKSTEHLITYPPVESNIFGWILTITGVFLILWSMFVLKKYGKGMPMNAFPPSHFVNQGPYRILRHPIYWGFGITLVGISLITGSASGLWLITPVTVLGIIALIWGYERIDLKKRFPDASMNTIFDLPENKPVLPSFRDYIISTILVIISLMITNFIVLTLTSGTIPLSDIQITRTPILNTPGLTILSSICLVIVPLAIKSKNILRQWVISALLGLVLSIFLALVYPSVGAQYLPGDYIHSDTIMKFNHGVLFVPVFLILVSLKSILKRKNSISGLVIITAALILVIIQLSNSRSFILHLGTSLLIFAIAGNYRGIWNLLKTRAEKIANSWKEWVFGKVRVINHGFYIGAAGFLGILLGGYLAGSIYAWAIFVFSLIVFVFSALWAQFIEGSEKLKRPFGFYGALVGIPFASFAVWQMGTDVWVVIAVFSTLMPWIQLFGRLRCLINGCCHGAPVEDPEIGIRYHHVRSRVCNISGLKGKLLHPTQLYAILWLFFVGFILLSLWNNHLPASFIFGLYLILSGIGRFVEEAYRGEVQTKILRGLRLYQWTAIVSVVIGIIMTMIPTDQILPNPGFSWEIFITAMLGGLVGLFGMGVDFPYSNIRFSRLV